MKISVILVLLVAGNNAIELGHWNYYNTSWPQWPSKSENIATQVSVKEGWNDEADVTSDYDDEDDEDDYDVKPVGDEITPQVKPFFKPGQTSTTSAPDFPQIEVKTLNVLLLTHLSLPDNLQRDAKPGNRNSIHQQDQTKTNKTRVNILFFVLVVFFIIGGVGTSIAAVLKFTNFWEKVNKTWQRYRTLPHSVSNQSDTYELQNILVQNHAITDL